MLTQMRREIEEIPSAVARLIEKSGRELQEIGQLMRKTDPAAIVTIARGSSDHAAHFLKYGIELTLGLPVASMGPSVVSVYQSRLRLERCVSFAISQSGRSPDIVALASEATRNGAYSIALLNTPQSPLADACSTAVDIAAGPEKAVAATKSFVNSVVAGLLIIAEWSADGELYAALQALPERLATPVDNGWSELAEALDQKNSLYVLGRGPSVAIAGEAALKCKETCELHAEAYSSAEIMHGPVSIVAEKFPILAFAARDLAEPAISKVADQLGSRGGRVFITSDKAKVATPLSFIESGHPLTDALAQIVPFYSFVEMLARRRGLDPDVPKSLSKITETI
ncbi:aminotransferase [Brucella anthropi]|uniref:SIS domain-containing protein n=1 Tax=Brucella anthropi TaxID=529 RepID=UPI00044E8C8F|nr:SIS domain-containing protein [Brucella anthropi]EXL02489.1 aminotransferase [Brucella anthropi]